MTEKKHSSLFAEVKALLADDQGLMKVLVKDVLQKALDVEKTEFLGADAMSAILGARATDRAIITIGGW